MSQDSMVRLKYLAGINDRSLPEHTDPDRLMKYIDISSVGRGVLVEEPRELRFEDSPARARRLIRDGDTIVSTVRTYLRAVWPVAGPTHDLVVSTGFAVLTPREIEPGFFSWWVRSDIFIEDVVARSEGVSYPAIRALELGELPVRVPPPDEQRAIADYLDTETARIDALITKKRRMIELLQERRVSVVDDCVAGSGGPLVALRRLASRITSGPTSWAQYVAEAGTPFLRITNIDRQDISLDMSDTLLVDAPSSAEASRTEVVPGDVLVSITADIGSVGVVPDQLAGANISQHVALVRPAVCVPDWLAYAIKSTDAQVQLDAGQHGATKTQLILEDIARLKGPCPEEAVQAQLLDGLRTRLKAIGATIGQISQQVNLLAEHRQALITAAVTGELRVSGVAA